MSLLGQALHGVTTTHRSEPDGGVPLRVTWPEALRRRAKANSAVWEDGPRPALPSGCSLGLLLVCKLVFLALALPVASTCFPCSVRSLAVQSLPVALPPPEVTCGNFGFTCPPLLMLIRP